MISRRLMILGVAAVTTSCGFHPVYGVHGPAPALESIYVGIIPNRSGQMLRQALQARLQTSSEAVAQRYVLNVSYYEAIQGLGVQLDNSTTRTRDIGNAIWSLHAADNPSLALTGGTVRSLDGYNIIDEQFFYADLSEDAAQRRLAQALADQIVLGLSVYFDKHPQPD